MNYFPFEKKYKRLNELRDYERTIILREAILRNGIMNRATAN